MREFLVATYEGQNIYEGTDLDVAVKSALEWLDAGRVSPASGIKFLQKGSSLLTCIGSIRPAVPGTEFIEVIEPCDQDLKYTLLQQSGANN